MQQAAPLITGMCGRIRSLYTAKKRLAQERSSRNVTAVSHGFDAALAAPSSANQIIDLKYRQQYRKHDGQYDGAHDHDQQRLQNTE